MKLEEYHHTVDISSIASKNQLLAQIAETFDEMDKWADMDWSRVELETEEDYIDEMRIAGTSERISTFRYIRVTVPGLPDVGGEGDGVEAGPVG